jgi:hypothetical protein
MQMLRAGAAAFERWDGDEEEPAAMVAAIYCAMFLASPSCTSSSTTVFSNSATSGEPANNCAVPSISTRAGSNEEAVKDSGKPKLGVYVSWALLEPNSGKM